MSPAITRVQVKPERKKIPYQYVFDKIISTTAQTKDNIKIVTSHDFVVTHIIGNSTELFTVQIQDSVSNKNWFESNINSTNLLGTAQLPNALPKNKFVRAGATITFFLYGSTNNANTIQLVLSGYEMPL